MKCDRTLKAIGHTECPEPCNFPTTGFIGTVEDWHCLNDVVTVGFAAGLTIQIKANECPEWIKPGARIKVEFNQEGATIELLSNPK
jgi:hypothetical protein